MPVTVLTSNQTVILFIILSGKKAGTKIKAKRKTLS
jgi:hypothetical protein